MYNNTVNNRMSIDRRYDALVSDLLTLFQELTLRYISQKTIDIDKFGHYFNLFYDRMQHLEGSFHQSKLKITHLVARLKQIFSGNSNANSNNQPIVAKNRVPKKQQTNQDFSKSFNRSISSKKQREMTNNLGSIVQEDQYPADRTINKRSQTASGYRSLSFNEERILVRPKTGQATSKKYSFDRHKISKTVNVGQQSLDTSHQREALYEHPYVLDSQQILSKRKKFYQQLQKQKDIEQPLSNTQMRWIFKRNKNKNGRAIKIGRLI